MGNNPNFVTIRLADISLWGYHGLDESESRNGGSFLMSLELVYEETVHMKGSDTIGRPDYAEITKFAVDIFTNNRFGLIETLASHIADKILLHFLEIRTAGVAIRKLRPVMPHILSHVEVSVSRSR